MRAASVAALVRVLLAAAGPACAEATTVRMSKQFGLGYLSMRRIKKKPASWRDLFFPAAHGLNGS